MKIKICTKCKERKPLDLFYKAFDTVDGRKSECKECTHISNRLYRCTKLGVATCIYLTQINSSKRRNYILPNYTREMLREWLFDQDLFNKLYNEWVKSGYDKYKKPSVDRKDDYKPYSFDNIRLVTWGINNKRSHYDNANGINNKRNKAVIQYDKQGNFIKEYYSISQASRETFIQLTDICNVCKGRRCSAGGFIWKYKNEIK